MKTDILIDKEFAALIPPLTTEELSWLEENILRDGVRDAVVAWQDKNILLDGHNRYALAHKHDIAYQVKYLKFNTRDEAKTWTIGNQLGRRNLAPDQVSYLRGKEYELKKKAHGERGEEKTGKNFPSSGHATAEKLADKHGVSERTIRNDAEYTKAVDALEIEFPDILKKVMKGEGPARKIILNASKEKDKEKARKMLYTSPHVSHNSGNNEWYTPDEIIELAKSVLGEIDLDPASSETANAIVGAKKIYTIDNDGLSKKWRGRVWMNPPYSANLILPFCEKITENVENGSVTAAIVLVNNGTETKWFQTMCRAAKAICFPKSRIKFWNHEKAMAAPLQGQAILYFGANPEIFWSRFASMGVIVDVRR